MFLLYNLLLTLFAPIWVPWMIYRTRKRKESPNWTERQGDYSQSIPKKQPGEKRIWVHAVSLGEMLAVKPFLHEIRRLRPDLTIILTTTTSTGYQAALEKYAGDGLYNFCVYFPIDLARFQLRAMQYLRPDVIAIMETELWFNFLWAADTFSVPTFVINGRMSDRAFRRSQKVHWFYRSLFKFLTAALVQSEVDAERFRSLNAPNVEVLGNTKFDESAILPDHQRDWRKELGIPEAALVVVVGSTRSEAEEILVMTALANIWDDYLPQLKVIHAPRHIENAQRCQTSFANTFEQKNVSIGFRSQGQTSDYLILDSYGELGGVFSIADVVVIGGGFDPLGGQNLIQPMALGKPVIHGPNMFNFREVSQSAASEGASVVAATADELSDRLRDLLNQPELRQKMGTQGLNLTARNLGASRRYAERVLTALSKSNPTS